MGFNTRSVLSELLQVGIENTPGTAVPANNVLSATRCVPGIATSDEDVTAQGQFMKTDVIVNKEHTTVALSGKMDIIDLGVYWLSGIVSQPVVSGNTLIYKYAQLSIAPRNTFTFEMGSAARAERMSGVTLTGLNITFATNAASTWTVSGFGRKLENAVTLTVNPTVRPNRPVSAKGGAATYISTTLGGLTDENNRLKGTILAGSFAIEGISEPTYAFDSVDSYSGVTDIQPSVTANISVVKNAAADAYMASYRGNAKQYARMVFNGPVDGGLQTQVEIIFPFKWKSPSLGEEANNYVSTYAMEAIYDATLGTGLQIKVTQNVVNSTGITEVVNADSDAAQQATATTSQQPSGGSAGSAT